MLLLSSAEFFFQNNLPGTLSECQTDWIQIRNYILFGPDLDPSYLQMTKFSACMQNTILYSIEFMSKFGHLTKDVQIT